SIPNDFMYGWRARIGFIVPSNNNVVEPELYHVVPDGVSFHFTKIVFATNIDGKNKDPGGEAATVLQRGGVDAIIYACMATSLLEASDWEQQTTLQTGIPAATAATAVKEALRAVGVKSVALVCHYPADRFPLLKESFARSRFDVVGIESAE